MTRQLTWTKDPMREGSCWDYRTYDKHAHLEAYVIKHHANDGWLVRERDGANWIHHEAEYSDLETAKAVAEALVAMR